jgi:hypothetical protein
MGQGFSFTPDFTPDASASSKSSEEEWPYDNLQWTQLLENASTRESHNDVAQLAFPWMSDFGAIDEDIFKLQLAQEPQFAGRSQLDPVMDDGTLKLFEDVSPQHIEAVRKDESQSGTGDPMVAIKHQARKRGRPRKLPEPNNDETRDQVSAGSCFVMSDLQQWLIMLFSAAVFSSVKLNAPIGRAKRHRSLR